MYVPDKTQWLKFDKDVIGYLSKISAQKNNNKQIGNVAGIRMSTCLSRDYMWYEQYLVYSFISRILSQFKSELQEERKGRSEKGEKVMFHLSFIRWHYQFA